MTVSQSKLNVLYKLNPIIEKFNTINNYETNKSSKQLQPQGPPPVELIPFFEVDKDYCFTFDMNKKQKEGGGTAVGMIQKEASQPNFDSPQIIEKGKRRNIILRQNYSS
jgi:hypothetical protein